MFHPSVRLLAAYPGESAALYLNLFILQTLFSKATELQKARGSESQHAAPPKQLGSKASLKGPSTLQTQICNPVSHQPPPDSVGREAGGHPGWHAAPMHSYTGAHASMPNMTALTPTQA